jgi:type III pantothenate kinase
MSTTAETGLLALDIGNSRVKLGWFPPEQACTSSLEPSKLPIASPLLPQPEETLAVSHRDISSAELVHQIQQWLESFPCQQARCLAASVCVEVEPALRLLFGDQFYRLTCQDIPLEMRVEQPEKVGVDRLLISVAANRLREPERAAVTVSVGTAITVNFTSEDGAFEGGAILPGIALSARALGTGTSSLPEISAARIDAPPEPVGKSTSAAIEAGVYWGAVGAIRQLVELQSQESKRPPHLFVTGGDAELLARHLVLDGTPARLVPHMALAGIALTAEELT